MIEIVDMSYLAAGEPYWNEWRFAPWADGTARGVYRRADFIKASLIGEVGRYIADDYIVWSYAEGDFERLFSAVQPCRGLMLQRFVFLRPEGQTVSRTRSFWLGVKGYAEFVLYSPLGQTAKRIRDLTQLVDAAHNYARKSLE